MATVIDETKLTEFLDRAVNDIGAVISAPLVLLGERLGLYKAMAGAGPLTSQQVAERAGAAERYVREWLRNQAAGGYVTYDARQRPLRAPARAGARARRRRQPGVHPRRLRPHHLAVRRRDEAPRSVPNGRRPRLARARPATLPWHRAVLPPRLQHVSGRQLDPRARRRRGQARRGAPRSPTSGAATAPRRSSWPRRSPAPQFHGFDYHEASIRRARAAAAEAGRRRPNAVRDGIGEGLPRRRVRPRVRLRLPARHGRSGRGGRARPRDPRPRRHFHARRARRRRHRRGQPHAGRTRLLRSLDGHLYAGVPKPGGRRSPSGRRPARRACATCSTRPASPGFAEPPKPLSTSSSKRGHNRPARASHERREHAADG